jgi:shikimate kinase
MKHILIYGPPGVGKLSIGRELAKRSGFGLLHNSLSVDLVREVFPFGHPEFSRLVIKFRNELFEAAARAKVSGLISTFVYSPQKSEDEIIRRWLRLVAKHGGQSYFVHLTCSKATLFKRVSQPSRKLHHKITSPKHLRFLFKQAELLSPVPFVASLEIDTEHLSPSKAAKLIQEYCGL